MQKLSSLNNDHFIATELEILDLEDKKGEELFLSQLSGERVLITAAATDVVHTSIIMFDIVLYVDLLLLLPTTAFFNIAING